jgi:hypothetical protein
MVHSVGLQLGVNFELFPGPLDAVLWSDAFDPQLTFSVNYFELIWTDRSICMSVHQDFF